MTAPSTPNGKREEGATKQCGVDFLGSVLKEFPVQWG